MIEHNYEDVVLRQWVLVYYEEELFIGRVVEKKERMFKVLCLKMPYLLRQPCDMEDDAVWYKTVYHTDAKPELKQVEKSRAYKYIY